MKFALSYWIILFLLSGCRTKDVFLQKPSALQLLSRVPRTNQFAEELKGGNLERECVEEACTKEEVQEIFEDDCKVESFWKLYIARLKCNSTTCQNNGSCRNTAIGVKCKCLRGFNGTFCETVFLQKPSALQLLSQVNRESLEQECVVETCSKEEIHEIFEDDSTTEFFWKIYIDRLKCNSTICQNNGICQDTFTGVQCTCLRGFNGTFCETARPMCNSMTCQNNGTCRNSATGVECKCLSGFNGTFCETDINECDLMPTCPQGMICVDGINKFTCICPAEGCYANSEL
ncbi:coagulation factor X-like [Hemitrygon akajei]|uniref:coagulation factor X-like n=1 Tax=Hemitrygon akajei TaxID=2704970 RepID=UPI003BF94623